jgi:hypothetical protein
MLYFVVSVALSLQPIRFQVPKEAAVNLALVSHIPAPRPGKSFQDFDTIIFLTLDPALFAATCMSSLALASASPTETENE